MNKLRTPWTEKKVLLALFGAILLIKGCLFLWAAACFNFSVQGEQNWLSIWDRWDSYWYQMIAVSGYSPIGMDEQSKAFMSHFPPFYPFLIRVCASVFFISARDAGFLLSFIFGLASSYLIYWLVIRDFQNQQMAVLAVLLFNLYPVAYFTNTIYSEALFTFLTLLAFCLLRQKHFVLPGLLNGIKLAVNS